MPQLSSEPITIMVARVRREYLPTVRTSSLSIGRPNSLGVSALSARNIWIPRVLNEVYYGICLFGSLFVISYRYVLIL